MEQQGSPRLQEWELSLAFLPSFFLYIERDEDARFPQSHGDEKGLEDLGGDKWGRGWAWDAPPPEMLMMEPEHWGPCFGSEVVSKGEGEMNGGKSGSQLS